MFIFFFLDFLFWIHSFGSLMQLRIFLALSGSKWSAIFFFISDAHINFVKQLVIRFPAFHTIEVLHLRPHSFVGCDRSFIYVSKRIRST